MKPFPEPRAGDICDHCNEGSLYFDDDETCSAFGPNLICPVCTSVVVLADYSSEDQPLDTVSPVWVYGCSALIFIPIFVLILKAVVFIVTYEW